MSMAPRLCSRAAALARLLAAAAAPRRRASATATATASASAEHVYSISSSPLLLSTRERALAALAGHSSVAPDAETKELNMCQAINEGLAAVMEADGSALLFGEDVAFGGVFRCSVGLRDRFGAARVFNTPLSEQGIAGFAIGAAAEGATALAEIQFADYVFPAFDQLVNEAAKMRFRSASAFDCGGLLVRMPCGAVGHGGLYHSQSPEAYFAHTPGLVVAMPRSPAAAKGLLIALARRRDPSILLEPKILYRAAREHVPAGAYECEVGRAVTLRKGSALTAVSYGAPLYALAHAIELVERKRSAGAGAGASASAPAPAPAPLVELIDMQTIAPLDIESVAASVARTGRLVIVHEAPVTCGVGAEIAAAVTERVFTRLEAPVRRVCGLDMPFPLAHEPFYVPGVARCVDAIEQTLDF